MALTAKIQKQIFKHIEKGEYQLFVSKLNGIEEEDINTLTHPDNGLNPLQYAIATHQVKIVEYILNQNRWTEAPSKNKNTPLHLACIVQAENRDEVQANNEIIRLLLEQGADIRATNNNGELALHMIARSGSKLSALNLLLTAYQKTKISIDTKNSDGNSALHLALAAGNTKTAEKLIVTAGANPYHKNKHNRTPIDEGIKRLKDSSFLENLIIGVGESACPPESMLDPVSYFITRFNLNPSLAFSLLFLAAIPTFGLYVYASYKEKKALSTGPLTQENLRLSMEQAYLQQLNEQLNTAKNEIEYVTRKIKKYKKEKDKAIAARKDKIKQLDSQLENAKNKLAHAKSELTTFSLPRNFQKVKLTTPVDMSTEGRQERRRGKELLTKRDKVFAGFLAVGKSMGFFSAGLSILSALAAAAAFSGPLAIVFGTLGLLALTGLVIAAPLVIVANYKNLKSEFIEKKVENKYLSEKNNSLHNEIYKNSPEIDNLNKAADETSEQIKDLQTKITQHPIKVTQAPLSISKQRGTLFAQPRKTTRTGKGVKNASHTNSESSNFRNLRASY